MIEDKKDGIKIAENMAEVLLRNTIETTETRIRQGELELDINRVVLKYLKDRKV